MKRMFWLSLLTVFLGAILPAAADGLIIVDEAYWSRPPRPPHPEPWRPRHFPPRPYAPLEVTYHRVNVKIDGQIATTSVDQSFYNPNAQQLEGTYLFPIPKGAQIDKFTMDIGGKQVQAELLPAAKARAIYEDIVRKMRDPALLEYAGQDVFKVRIFPIEPRSHKRITLSYSQVLKSDAGLVNYVYPLNTEKFSAKPIKDVSIKVEIESKQPLKSIYSPSHTVDIKRHGSGRATVGFEADNIHPDTDFSLYFAPEKDDVGVNLLTHRSGDDGYFLLLASPGVDVKEKQLVLKDVAFVLDTSGSMAGKKLEQAKKALQFCVENLNEGDRFEIVRFSTEVEPLFDKLTDASPANRERAAGFIKDLKPIGGTAIDDALRKALALRPDSGNRPFVVIFLTDGRPTVGTTDEDQIVSGVKKRNEKNTRVFCFGIGTDVNTHLLDKITESTRAFSQYVLPEEDLELKVSSFFSKIKEPVLANPALQFSGDVRATKLYPSPLPDLFKGEQLVLVGRYSGDGDSAITLEGSVNGTTRKFTYEVTLPRESSANDFIPRLWATRRVGYLLDEIRLHGENSELRDEVTELARKYGIVTPYTAYLIVEDESRRDIPMRYRSLQSMDQDSAVRREAARSWSDFNTAREGERAVAGAQLNDALKSAPATPAFGGGGRGGRLAQSSLGLSTGSAAPASQPEVQARQKLLEYSQQTRFVGGRNFFQNGETWIDTTVQKKAGATPIVIEFNSPEYFEFIAKNSEALPWLSLGQNVQFLLKDKVYHVR